MTIGYGTLPYGTGYYGTGVLTTPSANCAAYARGDRMVRVTLETEPQHALNTISGDALNPRTWNITDPASGKVWTVLSVSMVDAHSYDLVTLEIFPNHYGTLKISSTALLDVNGIPFPTVATTFSGAYLDATSTDQKRIASLGLSQKDIANVPTPLEDMVGGTLKINSSGDYVPMSGDELIKKLIIRRLVAKRGDFFHLPNYGAGLREKEPMPTVDLRKMARDIEQQVALEPEVAESKASLSYAASASALIIQLKVRLKPSGNVVQVALPLSTGTVQY